MKPMQAATRRIVSIETSRGVITAAEALSQLAAGKWLNDTFSQIVLGVYDDGRKVSLKGRRDGLYYMSGNYCSDVAAN